MKFISKFHRNGTLKTGSLQVLKSFRTKEDTNHHEFEEDILKKFSEIVGRTPPIATPPRTPPSVQDQNFAFWCNTSIRIHLVFNHLDANEYCKNLNSFVCKSFRKSDLNEFRWQ